MNRGSAPVCDASASGRMRFNEAPIHESGKCSRPSPNPTMRIRFNEAPIHESGKSGRAGTSEPSQRKLQ